MSPIKQIKMVRLHTGEEMPVEEYMEAYREIVRLKALKPHLLRRLEEEIDRELKLQELQPSA